MSKSKSQFCQAEVEYLGQRLSGNKRAIGPSQVEAITNAPKSQTVSQMLTFLGMEGYSRPWICDYGIKAAPLRTLIKAAGQSYSSTSIQWTEEAEGAFVALKGDLRTAPALGNPDYTEMFDLYVAEKGGFACAVLMQDTPTGKQPLPYYGTKMDNTEMGLPPCYQGLAAAALTYQKVTAVTMGHPVTIHTLTSPRFILTQARKTGYQDNTFTEVQVKKNSPNHVLHSAQKLKL